MRIIFILVIISSALITAKQEDIDNISNNIEVKSELTISDKILKGARIDVSNKPIYRSKYYSGGYPPKDEGVCTDVIWRALKEIDYNLKDKIDEDIKNNIKEYPRVAGRQDKNIDFRRVPNLIVYFRRNEKELNLNISEFEPGDIVTFTGGVDHIAIISDKKNRDGVPYLIHNDGPYTEEEDMLETWNDFSKLSHRFRIVTN
ncbi:MAG: DUF1287 domain-containing protein [Clostridia bacterium]|nr:DUF1287 domain-containing protein [Clostridia bacterium]